MNTTDVQRSREADVPPSYNHRQQYSITLMRFVTVDLTTRLLNEKISINGVLLVSRCLIRATPTGIRTEASCQEAVEAWEKLPRVFFFLDLTLLGREEGNPEGKDPSRLKVQFLKVTQNKNDTFPLLYTFSSSLTIYIFTDS